MEAVVAPPRPKMITRLAWIGVVVVLLAALVYFGVGAVVANSLTTPVRDFSLARTPAHLGLSYQNVSFPARADGLPIAAWYIPHEGSNRAVLLVHGRNCSRTSELGGALVDLAAALQRGGFNVLMIDLRGHGQSGDAHYSFGINERRDVEGAVDWLRGQGFGAGSIGVMGISLGAASAIGAAAEEPAIGAVAEDSGFAAFCPILQAQWGSASGLPDFFLPSALLMTRVLFGYDLCSARPVDEIGRIAPRPLLILHSTDDQLVPVRNVDQLKAAAPWAQTRIVSGPEHARSYNADPAGYSQVVIDFFDKGLER